MSAQPKRTRITRDELIEYYACPDQVELFVATFGESMLGATMPYPKCPTGRQDCRLSSNWTCATLMNSPIEFDRAGRPISGGRNKVSKSVTCSVCGASWTETRTELEHAQGKPAKWRLEPNT